MEIHVTTSSTLQPSNGEARTTCQNLGGDLPIIRSQDENNYILELLKKQETVQLEGAWIGLYRKADNTFYWIDDTLVTGQFSAWGNGEPNTFHEKCVHIYASWFAVGKWNDLECSLPQAEKSKAPVILCQKKMM